MNRALLCTGVLAGWLQHAGPALAEVCVYVDGEGHVTYSNVSEAPPRGTRKVRCFKESAPPAPPPAAAARPAQPQAGLQKIDEQTQKRRDDDRRRILEQELASEQQQLETARKELAAQEATRQGDERNYQRYVDRIQPYRDRVSNHERNIQALQQELSNMR